MIAGLGYVNRLPGTFQFRAYVLSSDPEKYDDSCIGYFDNEQDAWDAVLNHRPRNNSCMPGANMPVAGAERIEMGQVVCGKYLVTDSRFVRDGTFHAGHMEFLVTDFSRETWVKERTIQQFIIDNVVSLR